MSYAQPIYKDVSIYTSNDTDATPLESVAGALKTIFKSCLVTGHGNKQAAGWDTVFEDDYKIVLKSSNPLASGQMIMIDSTHADYAQIKCGIFSDIDTATSTFISQEYGYFALSYNDRTPPDWYLVCNDRFLMFFTTTDTWQQKRAGNMMCFGDCANLLSTDNTCIVLVPTPDASKGVESGYESVNSRYALQKTSAGVDFELLTLGANTNISNASDPILHAVYVKTNKIIGSLPFFIADAKSHDSTEIISANDTQFLRVPLANGISDNEPMCYVPLDKWRQ